MINGERRGCLKAFGLLALGVNKSYAMVGVELPNVMSQELVEVIVPYGPGGGADLAGRLVVDAFQAAGLERAVVLNRPGVAGTLGANQVARAAPDGKTWLISGIGSHVIAPQWQVTAYEPFQDFHHLAILGGTPSVLVANAQKRIRSLKDISEKASWASPGTGSHGHLLGTLIMQRLGLNKVVHVPYKGGATAMQDLLGGHVDLAVMTLSSFLPQAQNPAVVPLAITGQERFEHLPLVPTFLELGFKDLTATTWFGLSGPKGLPAAQVKWASQALQQHFKRGVVQKKLRSNGMILPILEPERAQNFMKDEWARWGRVIALVSGK